MIEISVKFVGINNLTLTLHEADVLIFSNQKKNVNIII